MPLRRRKLIPVSFLHVLEKMKVERGDEHIIAESGQMLHGLLFCYLMHVLNVSVLLEQRNDIPHVGIHLFSVLQIVSP